MSFLCPCAQALCIPQNVKSQTAQIRVLQIRETLELPIKIQSTLE